MKKQYVVLMWLSLALLFLPARALSDVGSSSSGGTFFGPDREDEWPRPPDEPSPPPSDSDDDTTTEPDDAFSDFPENESSGPSESELRAQDQSAINRATDALISLLNSIATGYARSDNETRSMLSDLRLREARQPRNLINVLNDGRELISNARQQLRSFITGDELSAAVAAEHNGKLLSDRERLMLSEAVGDPVRLTDGAYVSEIPLPVLRYHSTLLDMTIHYDSARRTVNTVGRGWFFPLDSRIYHGNRAPVEADALLDSTQRTVTETQTRMTKEWLALVNDPAMSPEQLITGIDGIQSNITSHLEELNDIETELANLRQRFRRPRLNFNRVAEAEEQVYEKRQKLIDLQSSLNGVLQYTQAWQSTQSQVQQTAGEINSLTTSISRMVELQKHIHRENTSVRRTGDSSYKELTGQDTIVLIDLTGSPRLFRRDQSSDTDEMHVYSATRPADGTIYQSIASGARIRVLPDGTEHHYLKDGRLNRIQDRNGNALSVQHPESEGNKEGKITTSTGYTLLRFRRDSSGLELSFSEGVHFTLRKNNGFLTRLESPRGSFFYTYHDEHEFLTEITGPSGTISKHWEEGPDGWRVYAVDDVGGGREKFGYPAFDRRTYEDQDGVRWEYRMINHRIAQIVLPTGGVSLHGDDYMQRGSFRRQWSTDIYGNHTRLEDSDGFWEQHEVDRFGEVVRTINDRGVATNIARDERGNAIQQRDATETELVFERNNDGTISRIQTSRGTIYTAGYDHLGRINHLQRTDGQLLSSSFDDFGRPRYINLPDGTKTTYTFNEEQRIYRIKRTRGEEIEEHLFHYDAEGNISEKFRNGISYRTSTWDPMGNPIRHDYSDGTWEIFSWTSAGRLLTHRQRSGQELQYFYDNAGSLYRIHEKNTGYTREISRDIWGRPVRVVDPDGAVQEFRFDPDGKLQWIREPDGTEIHYQHRPGGIVETRIHRGDETILDRRIVYDNAGRILRRYRAGNLVERWTYDHSTWTEWTYGIGTRHWELDVIGRPVRRVYPDSSYEKLHWNAADQLTQFTDRSGVTQNVENELGEEEENFRQRNMDLFNRTTLMQAVDETGYVWKSEISYPAFEIQEILRSGLQIESRQDRTRAIRQLTVANAHNWQIHFNSFGIPELLISPEGRQTRMSWDEHTRITSFMSSTPGAAPREYHYDAIGNLTEISTGTGQVTITRSPDRRTVQLQHGDERTSLFTDVLGNVIGERRTTPEGVVIDRTWERDDTGTIQRSVDHLTGLEIRHNNTPRGSVVHLNSAFRVEIDHDARNSSGMQIFGFTESPISIEIADDTITVDGSMRLIHDRGSGERSGDESFRLETLSPTGFSVTRGLISYVRDQHGRILGERNLSGVYRAYTYNDTGYLTSINATPQPGLRQRLQEVSARAGIRPQEIDLHRLPETRYLNRDRDGRLPQPDLEWDSAGRVKAINSGTNTGIQLIYDPLFEFVREVVHGDSGTFILADHRGSVAMVLHNGFRFTMIDTHLILNDAEITFRFWRREDHDPASQPAAPSYTGRFLPISDNLGQETEHALEILINRRPILSLGEDRYFFYLTDVRGTPQGVAIREHPGLTNYVSRDFDRSEDLPKPNAIPFGTSWALMDRIPGTDLFRSTNRTLIGDAEIFTTPDPDLDGLDFYLYAGGDPINHVDWDGLKIVAPKRTYFQQDPRWRDARLGNSSEHSIGAFGCKLVANARVVSSILNDPEYSPLEFNEALKQGNAFDEALMLREPVRETIEHLTGRSVTVTRVNVDEVNLSRLGEYLKDSSAEFFIVAEIRTQGEPGSAPNGGRATYTHFLSVVDITSTGQPIFSDTSNRNRSELLEGEELVSLEIFQAPACGTFR